jgi:hypothetical protein
MNEAETRAELIDPKLKACGWGVVERKRFFLNTAIPNHIPIWLKFLCDGYVLEESFCNYKSLVFNDFLCDGYVIEASGFICQSFYKREIINEAAKRAKLCPEK